MKIRKITYSKDFLKSARKLPRNVQGLLLEKEKLFLDNSADLRLHTHRLKGKMLGLWAFSVNYSIRVLFEYVKADEVIFHNFGTHEVYK